MLKKIRYRVGVLKQLNQFAGGVRRFFLLMGVITLLNVVVSFVIPRFYKLFIDGVIIGRDLGAFVYVVVGYLGMYLVGVVLAYVRNYAHNRLVNRTIFNIKQRVLSNYLNFSFEKCTKRDTGDLKMRIDDDVAKLADFAGVQSIDYLKAGLTALVAAGLIIGIEWRLAVFSIVVIPLTFYLDHLISLREKELQDINRGNAQKWNSWLHTSIQGWKEIKALNLQKHELRIFVRFAHNYAEFFGRWINFWVLRFLVIPKVKDEFLMQFALYFFGGLLIMQGKLTIGDLLVFAMYYNLLSESIRIVSSTDGQLQGNMPFYERVFAELGGEKVQARVVPRFVGSDIVLRNVRFAYDKTQPPVIENLSLEIKQGERVAIVGRSGAGKTTVLKLLAGMLTPDEGQIGFGGVDLREVCGNYLYRRVGFVLQENILFNMTIRENLRLAAPHADDEMLDEACKKACIYEFIQTQPAGYDTVIGEKGIKLSGGQRQRLVLARLFLRDVDVLIFDEATSSLDQYSESIIHDVIAGIGREKSIIIVAHRESSLGLCDRVCSLG